MRKPHEGSISRFWSLVPAVAMLAGLFVLSDSPASATVGDIITFADPGGNSAHGWSGITAGPDGNLWYTSDTNDRIGRITPAGVITTFADPAGESSTDGPYDIAAGSDGNLWYTSKLNNRIGRITPAGVITTYADPAGTASTDHPISITTGPDGNLWYTSNGNDRIGRIDPDAADPASTVVTFELGEFTSSSPVGIIAGPDGNIWYTSYNNDRIGRLTTAGVETTFVDSAGTLSTDGPWGITAGPDGNLWYTNLNNSRIGRLEVAPVPLDSVAPTATPTQSPAANVDGWNNSDVTVDWNWADEADGSGIDSGDCTTSSTSAGEGAAIELTATCSDVAGNTGEASYTVLVDSTEPTLSPSVSPDPVLVGGSATVTSGAADGLSGLASQSCGAASTVSIGVHTVECTATDVAGNSATASVSYRVEARVPHSKNDCKNGGWANLTDASGRPFRNQGDCVSYVATGGRNGAAG